MNAQKAVEEIKLRSGSQLVAALPLDLGNLNEVAKCVGVLQYFLGIYLYVYVFKVIKMHVWLCALVFHSISWVLFLCPLVMPFWLGFYIYLCIERENFAALCFFVISILLNIIRWQED